MFEYRLKGEIYIIVYLHMFRYRLKGELYIIAYLHMFMDSTYNLTMVIVGGWRSRFQSLAHIISSLPWNFHVSIYDSFRDKYFWK